jgi:uncharacterized membrane protein
LVDDRLCNWGIASIHTGTGLDAPAFSRAIEGARDIEIYTILAPTQRIFTAATFDTAPIAEVACACVSFSDTSKLGSHH